MSSKPFVKMSNDIALEFIAYLIQDGNPPLGIPFGWIQPSEDTTITLGSIYVSVDVKMSLKDLIYGRKEVGYFSNDPRKNQDFRFPSDMDSIYLREAIKSFEGRNSKRKISGLLEAENIHCQYSELERDEKLLYRLALLALNTMTECHNWSVSYLEFLAYNHYCFNDHWQLWHLYEDSYNQGILSAVSELIPYCKNIPDTLELYGYGIDNAKNDECYYYFNQWEDENTEIQEWIQEAIDTTDKTSLTEFIEKYDIREYDSEVIRTLSAVINWIQEEWNQGNLEFTLNENMPRGLYNWYKMVSSQMILPGIDET